MFKEINKRSDKVLYVLVNHKNYFYLLPNSDTFLFQKRMNAWSDTVLIFLCLGLLELSSALLEPSPFPEALRECYKFRSFNMTPSDEVTTKIQNFCYRQYQYQQIAEGKINSQTNLTQEGVNYIHGLFRQIFNEAREVASYSVKSKRHKRQALFPGRFRQEVRSPGGAFRRYARCIRRLQREVNTRIRI